jgi:hypothetical protein
MYRPYLVTRQERACFQLAGDRVDAKIRQRQPLVTAADRNLYWKRAIAQLAQKAKANYAS